MISTWIAVAGHCAFYHNARTTLWVYHTVLTQISRMYHSRPLSSHHTRLRYTPRFTSPLDRGSTHLAVHNDTISRKKYHLPHIVLIILVPIPTSLARRSRHRPITATSPHYTTVFFKRSVHAIDHMCASKTTIAPPIAIADAAMPPMAIRASPAPL